MRPWMLWAILFFCASLVGGVFIFQRQATFTFENIENIVSEMPLDSTATEPILNVTSTPEIEDQEIVGQVREALKAAESVITDAEKFIEEEKARALLVEAAKKRADNIRGIYVGGMRSFGFFDDILDRTELNALVIDIKESYGPNLSASLKNSIAGLHEKDIWVIARIAVFRDSSLLQEEPGCYLTFTTSTQATGTDQVSTTTAIWQDSAGQYWLDPENPKVRDYILDFSKKAVDFGFDELQFDYIRYPDDYYQISGEQKIEVIGNFISDITNVLRAYKPTTILSVDFFGYLATQFNSYEIGQRLYDAGQYFDYISLMLYPSHFYGGFRYQNVSFIYPEVVEHPYEVVFYSTVSAKDYLEAFGEKAKIRPWLQDFNLKRDSSRDIFYDAEKVRLQIEAAENATSSGWLLWNPSYEYTIEALASSTVTLLP